MTSETRTLSILFADICGSTRMFETLGDVVARQIETECLALLSEVARDREGSVVKTVGDEIMCTFPTAELAVAAAMKMQSVVREELPRRQPSAPPGCAVRIGVHHGPAILEDGDVFGDAVNMAHRMSTFAKRGQIATTPETVELLSGLLRTFARPVDRVRVKGKSEETDVFEIVWQPDRATVMRIPSVESEPEVRISLSYEGKNLDIGSRDHAVVLGRSTQATVVLNDVTISREHARVECRRGKFVLIDQSTNGTYVRTPAGNFFLRREEIALTGTGEISLGRPLHEATTLISYECR